MTSVKYRTGVDNGLLKVALLEAWKGRCYWCRVPVGFHEADIDHLIPHTWDDSRVDLALRRLEHHPPIDLHSPANLAPIHHTPCNNDKSDRDFVEYLPFTSAFQRARELSPKVVAKVESLLRDKSLSQAGAVLLAANIRRPGVRDQVETYTRSLSSALWGPPDTRWVEGLDERGMGPRVLVDLANDKTKAAVSILEGLWSGGLDALVEETVSNLCAEAREAVTDHFDGMEVDGLGLVSASDAVDDYTSVVIDSVDMERAGAEFTFMLNGQLEVTYSASLVASSPNGDGLLDTEQGDADLVATFVIEVLFSAESEDGDSYDILACTFESFSPEYWSTLGRFAEQAYEEQQHHLWEGGG